MEKVIALISGLVALATFIFKVWTDWKTRKEKFKDELRSKRSNGYQDFLLKLSEFLGDTDSLEKRASFLQLCYKMILVSETELKAQIEDLLQYVIAFGSGEIDEEQFKSEISKDSKNEKGVLDNIIQIMRKDLNDSIQAEHSKLKWIEAIEFLTKNEISGKNSDQDARNSDLGSQYFWINSCEKYLPGAWENMFKNNLACTYGPLEYGNKLKRIKSDDYVLLYLSGTGIVGVGKVITEFMGDKANSPKTIPEFSEEENEYQIEVDWELKGNRKKRVSSREIKSLGHHIFVPTVMLISSQVGSRIKEILSKKLN